MCSYATISFYFTILLSYLIFFIIYNCIIMLNLAKLEFVALDITGKNFLSWILDAEIHLDANGLGNTIKKRIQHPFKKKPKR